MNTTQEEKIMDRISQHDAQRIVAGVLMIPEISHEAYKVEQLLCRVPTWGAAIIVWVDEGVRCAYAACYDPDLGEGWAMDDADVHQVIDMVAPWAGEDYVCVAKAGAYTGTFILPAHVRRFRLEMGAVAKAAIRNVQLEHDND